MSISLKKATFHRRVFTPRRFVVLFAGGALPFTHMLALCASLSGPLHGLLHVQRAARLLTPCNFPRAIVLLRKSAAPPDDEQERQRKLVESLNIGMNSWNSFEEPTSKKKAATKNAAKASTKRHGKDGKIYLRDGPKRKGPSVTRAPARRKSTSSSTPSATAPAEATLRVRIEESNKLTVIKGLESLPLQQSQAMLKELKQALAVGGRVHATGELELKGAHAERVMLRLQRQGWKDVKLSGGAGAKQGSALAWNAPKDIRERAEAAKRDALRAKKAKAAAERERRKSPAAVAEATLKQLRRSERDTSKMLKRSDLPKAERKALQAKMERILQRLEEK